MATYTDAIQKLYVAYFSRPADPAGLAYWEGVVTAAKGDTSAVSAAFAASTEYQTEYAQITTAGVITKIYANLFGVVPDAAGLAYWIDAIQNKVFTIDQAVTKIAAGAQGSDKVAYDSKVLVATSFTAAVDTEAEKAGYNGKDANKAAKDFLATIKTAADATAAITPAALDAKVSDVVKAGVPFTLAGALTALNAANAADAAFIKANGDAAALKAAADALAVKVDTAGVVGYAAASDGVKAALLADQQGKNTDKLVADQVVATKAAEAVAKVAGLSSAVAAATAADAAIPVAAKAAADAAAKQVFTVSTFNNASGVAAVTPDPVTGVVAGLTKVDATTGKLVLVTGVTETTNPGVTALLDSIKANLAAAIVASDAVKAAAAAHTTLERTDFVVAESGTELAAVGAGMTIVKIVKDGYPTGAQIDAEYAGLNANVAAAAAAVKAAASGSTAAQDAAALAKTAADAALTKFDNLVKAFDLKDVKDVTSDALVAANAQVTADQKVIKDLADAVAKLGAAIDLQAQLKALDKAVVDANKTFTDHNFETPVTLSAFNVGTSADDIFVAGKVNSTVTDLSKTDKLFIGTDYVLNTGDLKSGNDLALEIFLKQSGADTVVTMEKAAYGSHSGDTITITLVGVNATDVHFANGIVTV